MSLVLVTEMKMPPGLKRARFLRRLNRFTALVDLDGVETLAHVPNSGRLKELFEPGRTAYLVPALNRARKTAYTLALIDLDGVLVSADATLPNRLALEALRDGLLPQFSGFDSIRPEYVFRESRLDFLLSNGVGQCLIEVKSVTLVADGVGLFPDAPTERGRKHVESLVQATREGYRAAVLFVIQREDALAFSPNDATDFAFGKALRGGVSSGVEVYAYNCRVSRKEVRLDRPVQLRL